jgi:hypothetical protein
MDNWIYAGFVAAGAVTLAIEALRTFREPVQYPPFERYPILKDLALNRLCTKQEWVVGFFAYAALYLVLYVALLSSTELLTFVLNANQNGIIGAQGETLTGEADTISLNATSYGKPIFVSAAIITFLSLGAIKPVETTLRGISHRIAGIPRGVFSAIGELQKMRPSFDTPVKQDKAEKKLSKELRKHMAEMMLPSIWQRAENGSHRLKKINRLLKAGDPHVDHQHLVTEIKAFVTLIDIFENIVLGDQNNLHFGQLALEKLSDRIKAQREALAGLDREISNIANKDTDIRALHATAQVEKNNMLALFAVIYIRNNRTVQNTEHSVTIQYIRDRLEEAYNAERNSLTTAVLFAAIATVFVNMYIYYDWTLKKGLNNTTPASMVALITEGIDKTEEPSLEGIKPEQCFAFAKLEKPGTDADSSTDVTNASDEVCQALLKEGAEGRAQSGTFFSIAIQKSIFDAFTMSLLTAAVGGLTIFLREMRKEEQRWREWSFRHLPILRLLAISFFPAILAILAVAFGDTMEFLWERGFHAQRETLNLLFTGRIGYYCWFFVSGMWLSLCFLVIADQHDFFSARVTVFVFALMGSLIFFLSVRMGISATYGVEEPIFVKLWTLETRDALLLSVAPTLSLLIFASLLELGEKKQTVNDTFRKFAEETS